jgi:Histidine kinase
VTRERLRIARELHDVIAHSMSVIAVQSAVGNHVIDSQPAQARQALAAIEATSRSALTEMRRLLGVLRQDGEPRGSLRRRPGWPTWPRSSARSRTPGSGSGSTSTASGGMSRRASTGLLAGIRVVAAGDALLAPSVTRQLIIEFVRRPGTTSAPPPPRPT